MDIPRGVSVSNPQRKKLPLVLPELRGEQGVPAKRLEKLLAPDRGGPSMNCPTGQWFSVLAAYQNHGASSRHTHVPASCLHMLA